MCLKKMVRLAELFLIAGCVQLFGVDLNEEEITAVVEWGVPENIGSSPHNFDNIYSYLYTYKGYTYAVFTDKDYCPRVAKINDGEAQVEKVADGYRALADGHNTFSIGIDNDGYIHIAGDMHHHPHEIHQHLKEPYMSSSCLYWKSDKPEDISSFTFYGNDEVHVIPGTGFTYLNFYNDNDGDLYTISRQWVRNDNHWTYNSGKIALGMARYDVRSKTWIPLGAEAPVFSETHPRSVTHLWEPNHNKVIFWEYTGVDSTCYQTWGNDVFVDDNNRIYLVTGINTDFSSNGSHPGSGTAICYAYSDDKGETWHRANGDRIESLPMRASTADIVASGHWYVMEAGVTISPNGKPLVSYRYTEDGTGGKSTSRWREYGESGWQDEVVLPHMYRRAKPRVDRKGVITITEYDDIYRTTAYSSIGVETEMPNEVFAFDKGFFKSTGKFRMTAKVRVGNKDQFGIVRLDITPEATVTRGKHSERNTIILQKKYSNATHIYDLRGRTIPIERSRSSMRPQNYGVFITKHRDGTISKYLFND